MNIIITGTSRGIGAELVKQFVKQKGHQIIAISRSGEALHKLTLECIKISNDSKVHAIEFDLAQFDFYPFLIEKIEHHITSCDILINNAGTLYNKPIGKLDLDNFDDIFNVNVKAAFFLSQRIIPMMMAKGGHIINIGSVGGIQGSKKFPGLSLYSASKAAIAVLTESMAEELRETGIKVNCLALGATQTEMFEKAFPGAIAAQSPHQLAHFILDFSLNGPKYFNGKVLPVSLSTP